MDKTEESDSETHSPGFRLTGQERHSHRFWFTLWTSRVAFRGAPKKRNETVNETPAFGSKGEKAVRARRVFQNVRLKRRTCHQLSLVSFVISISRANVVLYHLLVEPYVVKAASCTPWRLKRRRALVVQVLRRCTHLRSGRSMFRVVWVMTGRVVATFAPEQVEGKSVRWLKTMLAKQILRCGCTAIGCRCGFKI